jgi:hypothetical protein
MLACVGVPVVALLLAQSGWALAQAKPREVGRTYWALIPEMEVWLRLVPENPDGTPPLVNLVFHAFFPGRAERNPYTGLPQWPRGAPVRLTLSAEPLPTTVTRELQLRLDVDGVTIDLTGTSGRFRHLPCLVPAAECVPNGVEADVDPSIVRSMAAADSIGGLALGFPVTLASADRDAVREFAVRSGLAVAQPRPRW